MKIKLSIILLLFLSLAIFSFIKNDTSTTQKINENYNNRLLNFKQQITILLTHIENKNTNKALLQQQYLDIRKSFKSNQYLLEYAEPILIKDYINSAPLPKLEANSFGANTLQPHGLQVIDELIFSDTVDKESIIEELNILQKTMNAMGQHYFYDRDVFIAARIEMIRIASMGITGFDVPASGNAITDVASSINAIHTDLKIYKSLIESKQMQLSDSLFIKLNQTENYLMENQNFGSFNRFYFTQNYINPLFELLLNVHILLGYEMPNEFNNKPQAVNYLSKNIFDAQFLNAAYYLNIPNIYNTPQNIALGKLLFFDPILSENNQRACASCHNPIKGFTDNAAKSIGYNFNGTLKRNAPSLLNCVYSDRYFHDLRARGLTDQMEHVITSKAEFNTDWHSILEKLKHSNEYMQMFKAIYKNEALGIQQVQFSIAAYVGSLNGFNSTFDKLMKDANFKINNKQNIVKGYNLFMGKAVCGTCHFAPVFNGTVPPYYTDSESEILGVAENPNDKIQHLSEDKGRGQALLKEQVPFYEYSFKTPIIRNIALTAPYMHNGAYKNLQAVMKFYNNGGGEGVGIHLPYQTLATDKLELSKKEIADIISFMNALTDNPFIEDTPKFLPSFKDSTLLNSRKIGGVY